MIAFVSFFLFVFVTRTNSYTCTNLAHSTWYNGPRTYPSNGGMQTGKYFCLEQGALTSENLVCFTEHDSANTYPLSWIRMATPLTSPDFVASADPAGRMFGVFLPGSSYCVCTQLVERIIGISLSTTSLAIVTGGSATNANISFRYDIYSMRASDEGAWMHFRVGNLGAREWPVDVVNHYVYTNSTPQKYIASGGVSRFYIRMVVANNDYARTSGNEFSFFFGERTSQNSCMGFLNNSAWSAQSTTYMPNEFAIANNDSLQIIDASFLGNAPVVFGIFRKNANNIFSFSKDIVIDVSYCALSNPSCALYEPTPSLLTVPLSIESGGSSKRQYILYITLFLLLMFLV